MAGEKVLKVARDLAIKAITTEAEARGIDPDYEVLGERGQHAYGLCQRDGGDGGVAGLRFRPPRHVLSARSLLTTCSAPCPWETAL